MSKYSGLFLSFLLIFVCLWININRFPQVWEMVNGTGHSAPVPGNSPDEDTLETNHDSSSDSESFYAHIAGNEERWPKPVVISANPLPAGEDWTSGKESDFQQVSYSANQCSAETVSDGDSEEGAALDVSGEDSQTEEPEEGQTADDVKVHSSYMAAEFSEDSSPLSPESPSYEVP